MGARGSMACDPGLISFDNGAALAERLADVIALYLNVAILEDGAAALAVSGGSTPAPLYNALSQRKLDWSRVTVVLVDERWVAPGAEGSNESFIRATLIRNRAAQANIIGLWSDQPSPADGLSQGEARLNAVERPFDAVVLGMGTDGHTASWFPRAQGLEAALDQSGARLAALKARPSAVVGAYGARMTLTLSAIRQARFISLLVTGDEKRAVFDEARGEGSVEEMPVRAILRARPDLWVCWAPKGE